MKKFFLSFAVFAVSAAYVAYQYLGGSSVSAAVVPTTTTTQVATNTPSPTQTTPVATTPTQTTTTPTPTTVPTQTTPTQTTTPTPVATPTPAPVTKPNGQYTDGTYTGAAADAYYGMVQIQVVIQGGKLVTVNFLQYPNDRNTSRYINSQAMPELKSEAIAAQSANVSGVSGASDTSQAFIQSLGDALAKAKA